LKVERAVGEERQALASARAPQAMPARIARDFLDLGFEYVALRIGCTAASACRDAALDRNNVHHHGANVAESPGRSHPDLAENAALGG
jgi:hypothetical protein